MRILFAMPDVFLGEPFGVLGLVAMCRRHGHDVRLIALKKQNLQETLETFKPQMVAYSTMSPFKELFREADQKVLAWASRRHEKVWRIMGGPHPTFFPEVLDELDLDAICVGEGDEAMPEVIARIEQGQDLENIANIVPRGGSRDTMLRSLVQDLDSLPFIDRQSYFDCGPVYRTLKMRGVMTSRGCPYNCTYCHNHAFHKLFRGMGKIIRRRSVDNVLEEVKYVVKDFGPVGLIRFTDDTFAHTIDDWLLEFLPRYRKEIGLPFYCLMRSNTLSRDMAKLLSEHGCVSIGMSVESGIERIRNEVLKRNLSDDLVRASFKYANEFGIKTFGNTILAIPSGTIEDDLESYRFTRSLRMTAPTFGVFMPYARIELTEFALENGYLGQDFSADDIMETSPLTSYTEEEKDMQVNITHLGPLFCALPDWMQLLFEKLIRTKPKFIYRFLGSTYLILKMGWSIYPKAFPLDPGALWTIFLEAIKYRNVVPKAGAKNETK